MKMLKRIPCGSTPLPFGVHVKGNKIFRSPGIVQELNCMRSRTCRSAIVRSHKTHDQYERNHRTSSRPFTSTEKQDPAGSWYTSPRAINLRCTSGRERERSGTSPASLTPAELPRYGEAPRGTPLRRTDGQDSCCILPIRPGKTTNCLRLDFMSRAHQCGT